MTRWRLLLAVLLVVSMAAPLGAAGVAAQEQNATSTAEPQQKETSSDSGYTYEELKQTGPTYGDSAPPSMRFIGDYGSTTIRYTPVGPGTSDWQYLERGETINADEIGIRSVRLAPEDQLEPNMTVHVVAWQKDEKVVKKGNTTTTEPVARNVTEYTHKVRLGRGYDLVNVSLPSHFDQTYQITMWIEEYPDARWRFAHRSVQTSEGLPFASTWGGYWKFTTTNLLIWIVGLTGITAVAVPSTLKRTGRGPNMGLAFWFLVLGIGGAAVGFGAYVWTASLLSSVPPVVGFLIAGVIGIVMLETIEYGVYTVALMRLFTSEKKNPRGDIAREAEGGEFETITLAETENGTKAISDGIRPWIARLWTGGADLVGTDRLGFEFQLGSPEVSLTDSVADKLVFVDSDADQLIDHERERVEFDLPIRVTDPETGETRTNWAGIGSIVFHLVVGGALGLLVFRYLDLGGARIGAALFGAAAVYIAHAVPHPGRAEFLPAVGMAQDAVATSMEMQSEIADYETLEEAMAAIVEERNSSDSLLEKLEEMDAESVVKDASSRDQSPGSFVDDTSPGETAEGDD